MLVEAEVRNQPFQLPVLILELLQTPQLANPKPAVHLLPAVKRLLEIPIRRMTSATGVPFPTASARRQSARPCTTISSFPGPCPKASQGRKTLP
jgi:hypothetical protein